MVSVCSNNAAENAIRPVALGRKNWLFAGSDAGGERAALFYTLIRTATLNGVEPEAYLRQVIARIGVHPVNRLNDAQRRRLSRPPSSRQCRSHGRTLTPRTSRTALLHGHALMEKSAQV